MVDFLRLNSAIERVLIISWILKDFGWMITNSYLGFPFGFVSVMLHAIMVIIDKRKTFKFYNISLLLWVSGNFLWMTDEIFCSHPSSNIHIGPKVPLGRMNITSETIIIQTKNCLFGAAILIQLTMYIGIYLNKFTMPEDTENDILSLNEAQQLLGSKIYGHQSERDILILNSNSPNDEASQTPKGWTLAFIENVYIVLWISKDLFWAWGTGDLQSDAASSYAVLFEILAMSFGFTAVIVYTIVAYIYRRHFIRLLDCITTICWICANFIWMSGEFFIRYDNLTNDDSNAGNDGSTRLISSCLFSLGLILQFLIIIHLSFKKLKCFNRSSKSVGVSYIGMIPTFGAGSNSSHRNNNNNNAGKSSMMNMRLGSFKQMKSQSDDDIDSIVLF